MPSKTFWTCYEPQPADPGGPAVAHAVDDADPARSVAGEPLRSKPTADEWPGQGPPCPACAYALHKAR